MISFQFYYSSEDASIRDTLLGMGFSSLNVDKVAAILFCDVDTP